jgi:hypothetical protein
VESRFIIALIVFSFLVVVCSSIILGCLIVDKWQERHRDKEIKKGHKLLGIDNFIASI